MQTKGFITLAAVMLLAIGLYLTNPSSEDNTSATGTSPMAVELSLRAHIPADSPIFFLNETALPTRLIASSDASFEQLAQLADSAMADNTVPAKTFWASIASRYLRSVQEGEQGLSRDWGFGEFVHSAIYFVGIFPVIEVSVADSSKIVAQVKSAAEKSGLALVSSVEGDAAIHRVEFNPKGKNRLGLLVRETDGWVRLALESPVSDELSALIAGSVLPEKSLANTDTLDRLHASLGIEGNVVGAFNFLSIVKAFTDNNSLASKMIAELSPENDFRHAQTPECKRELVDIVSTVPEWFFASDIQPIANNSTIKAHTRAMLNIANTDIASQLQKLNGVLPHYDDVAGFDPIYSAGLGIDISQLTPVLMDLHQRIITAEYSCSYMQTVQEKLSDANPAMLGVATAMISGLKGISVTLNDFAMSDNGTDIDSASAVISISAVSARQLLSLVQGFVPDLAALTIPQDGSPVALKSAALPPSVPPIQIALKGEHHAIIMTEDPLAVAMANSFNNVPITPSGFLNTALNMPKLIEKIDLFMSGTHPLKAGLTPTECATTATVKSTYASTKLKLKANMAFTDKGLMSDMQTEQNILDASTFQVQPGRYDVYLVSDGCVPELDTTETLNSDGTGFMQIRDAGTECKLGSYEAEYNWQQKGRSLNMHFLKNRWRDVDACNATWSEWETPAEDDQETCVILNMNSEKFECVSGINTDEPRLYQFQKTVQ